MSDIPDPIGVVTIPIRLAYDYTPGRTQSMFLRGVAEGRVLGSRCPACRKVYVPGRGVCSMCGELFLPDPVEIGHTGTLVTYAVTNVPSKNIDLELPYVNAEVLLDGADTTSMFLMRGVAPDEVRLGMRVRLHWRPEDEWELTLANIEFVEPIDEPDVPYEQIEEYA